MKGNPKYRENQLLTFEIEDRDGNIITKTGRVYIVDAYGTWDNPNDVSYDIMVDIENCLYKHIPETCIIK